MTAWQYLELNTKNSSLLSFFLKNKLYFLEQFWVQSKIKRKVQRAPTFAPAPSPHTHSFLHYHLFAVVQLLSPTLCNSMDCSMPGFPVLHYLPEFAYIRVVNDAI